MGGIEPISIPPRNRDLSGMTDSSSHTTTNVPTDPGPSVLSSRLKSTRIGEFLCKSWTIVEASVLESSSVFHSPIIADVILDTSGFSSHTQRNKLKLGIPTR